MNIKENTNKYFSNGVGNLFIIVSQNNEIIRSYYNLKRQKFVPVLKGQALLDSLEFMGCKQLKNGEFVKFLLLIKE